MLKTFLIGVSAALVAIPCALAVSAALAWFGRKREYWSSVLSDEALHRISQYHRALVVWPVFSAVIAMMLARYASASLLVSAMFAVAVTIGTNTAGNLLQHISRQKSFKQDLIVSKHTQDRLEPLIVKKWTEEFGGTNTPRIEVRAYRTRFGVRGSVTVWIPSDQITNKELFDKLATVVPSYLKLRIRNYGGR